MSALCFCTAVAQAPTVTWLCQKSAKSIMVEWTVPEPIGFTTGYRIHYYTNINDPLSTAINILGGLLTTSYILTDLGVGLYYISVEGVSVHFSSGQDQAMIHPFEVRSEDEPYMCVTLNSREEEECEMGMEENSTEGEDIGEGDGSTGGGIDGSGEEEDGEVGGEEDYRGGEMGGEEEGGGGVEEEEGRVEEEVESSGMGRREYNDHSNSTMGCHCRANWSLHRLYNWWTYCWSGSCTCANQAAKTYITVST